MDRGEVDEAVRGAGQLAGGGELLASAAIVGEAGGVLDLTGEFGDVSCYWASAHTGLDFATGSGTPIRSVSDGVVTSARWDGSYGYKTVVRLEDGSVLWYCHQDSVAGRVGQRLAAGDVLGFVGSSGNVTGAHLHLEVRRDGQLVDPYARAVERGLRP